MLSRASPSPAPTSAGPYNERMRPKPIFDLISTLVSCFSAEFILQWLPNGGTVIILRSLWTGILLNSIALTLLNLLDPRRTWRPSLKELETQIITTIPWTGAILGAVYASLYARFASQWGYLANVYNQIKAAECVQSCNRTALAEWKAGFMEDAEHLHLARKPVFASIIHSWAEDFDVKRRYVEDVPGGERRFELLTASVREIVTRTAGKYEQQADENTAVAKPINR